MVEETKVLEKLSEDDQTQYWRMKLPLMSARESCVRIQVKDIENGNFILVSSKKHPDAPCVDGAV
tara:strand:- start:154 stop:348 length:195 start_codon:yes stop_codon:yes gene_type:complete